MILGTGIKEVVVSWIRTSLVPPAAAIVIQWLLSTKIEFFDTTTVYGFVTLVLTGIWYVVFRGIEVLASKPSVKKWAGIFLGYPRFNENS